MAKQATKAVSDIKIKSVPRHDIDRFTEICKDKKGVPASQVLRKFVTQIAQQETAAEDILEVGYIRITNVNKGTKQKFLDYCKKMQVPASHILRGFVQQTIKEYEKK